MGLPQAIRAHKEGNLVLAEQQYQRAYKQRQLNSTLYMNYGALLRSIGKNDMAEKIYKEGYHKYPNSFQLLNNYCNLMRDKNPCFALSGYLKVLHYRLNSDFNPKEISNAYVNIAEVLYKLGFSSLCSSVIAAGIYRVGLSPDLLRLLIIRINPSAISNLVDRKSDLSDPFVTCILQCISKFSPLKRSGLYFALASYRLHEDQPEEALIHFRRATTELNLMANASEDERLEAQNLVDIHSWNFACTLLKLQFFSEGWKLYESGLRAPCAGPQKWQRALKKPFTSSQISLWRGESLARKHLLVMEEQGIGDGMMFLTLIPSLINECSKLSILLSPRLYHIYLRSFAEYIDSRRLHILTAHDIINNRISPEQFDYQIPLGSICQHRYTDIESYAPSVPILKSDRALTAQLRAKYLSHASGDSNAPKKIIGISWRGGGRPDRIKQKSLEFKQFETILSSVENCRFVFLQYGSCDTEYISWCDRGFDVIYDKSIDPLKDMNSWLNQVASCDAVISVANTTIHGAGGLNIPTLCLLGLNSDWRWFSDINTTRSYWYPSVGIARQDPKDGWSPAITSAKQWLLDGAPYPNGLVCTSII